MENNCTNDAEWVIAHDADLYVFHPETNIVCSWIGYALLALMLYACVKKGVYQKRAHDVFLILFFAFITDIFEMRLNFFFIFGFHDDNSNRDYRHVPTTIGACTIGVWVFYFHFLNTYVEAMVSIYRFITRTIGKKMSVVYVYIGLGIIFALQGALFFETFMHGTPKTVIDQHVNWPVYCTKAYILGRPAVVSQIATAVTMSITPILSVIMLLKKSKSHEKESGVTAFNLLSSFSMMVLVYFFLWGRYGDAGKWIPARFEYLLNMILYVALEIQYFRFPLLCVSAVIVVKEIRDAVLPYILRTGEAKTLIPQTITNENYVEDNLE